jgi:hypothetical protein
MEIHFKSKISDALCAVGRAFGCTNFAQVLAFAYHYTLNEIGAMP